jgi:hypothetical protein
VTIITGGLRNKLPGRDEIPVSAPAEARPVTVTPVGRQAGFQRNDGDIPSDTYLV